MIFNRKNKIIGFKPNKQALEEKFHSRLLEHSSENCQKSYRKHQKKPRNQVDNTHKRNVANIALYDRNYFHCR